MKYFTPTRKLFVFSFTFSLFLSCSAVSYIAGNFGTKKADNKKNGSDDQNGDATPVPDGTKGPPNSDEYGVVANGKTYCQFSWEDKPGYADYTTVDSYDVSQGIRGSEKVDRTQNETLQGSNKLSESICGNAKLLKVCYLKAVKHDKAGNATDLVAWAQKNSYDLALIKMAFGYQETRLGSLKDSCSGGSCNGIGIAQIITAIKPNGGTLSNTDPMWKGITFNVLTNLSYSSRVLQEKLRESGSGVDLITLARNYNGNPDASVRLPYGPAVKKWYEELLRCQ